MPSQTIQIVCPAKPGAQLGNRISALRWSRALQQLGYRVQIVLDWQKSCDVLIALHAKHSADAIQRFRAAHADKPLILVVTGTDLYRDGKTKQTQQSLQLADRIVVLQAATLLDLPKQHHAKTRVIHQSVKPSKLKRPHQPRSKRVIVAGHLRALKDPFRAALAVRNLPADSKIVVQHFGGVIEAAMERKALAEMQRNARYHWFGEITRSDVQRRLATCWLTVLSSKMEGGANVVSEAIVNHTPVLASYIPGSIGLLGSDYDGYFEVGNTQQLCKLLLRCETKIDFYAKLQQQIQRRAPLFHPQQERKAWKNLLAEF